MPNPGLARECTPVHAGRDELGDPDQLAPLPDRVTEVSPGPRVFVAGDLVAAMDDHTRALFGGWILDRRVRLVPRSLMFADVLGLSLAYLVTTLFWGGNGAFGSTKELVIFCATLPCWLAVAKLQGLYRADQEHANHSTADDVVSILYLVTIGVWLLLVSSRLLGRTSPSIYALITFWAIAICSCP